MTENRSPSVTDVALRFAADMLGDDEDDLDVTVRFHFRKGVCDEASVERDVVVNELAKPTSTEAMFYPQNPPLPGALRGETTSP